jgi:hypothetical protein
MYVASVVCCQRSLRRANHSSSGVLPTVVCRCVLSRYLENEEAMAHWGLSRQKQTSQHLLVSHRALRGNLFMFPSNTPTSVTRPRHRYVHFLQSLLSFLDHKKVFVLNKVQKRLSFQVILNSIRMSQTFTYILQICNNAVYQYRSKNCNVMRQTPRFIKLGHLGHEILAENTNA